MNIHDSLKARGLAGLDLKRTGDYDDERCPVCGAETDGYKDLEFFNGSRGCGINVIKGCYECGSSWTDIYVLDSSLVYFDGLAKEEA